MDHAAPQSVGLDPDSLAAIDAYLEALVEQGAIPGAVMLIARHGRVCHLHATGWKDMASAATTEVDGLYRIFSMTKPVTAAALMMLWDEGRWDFDDPVARHLPEFEGLRVYAGKAPDGLPLLVAPNRPPTMRELVTHSAGFAYGSFFSDPADPVEAIYRTEKIWEATNLDDMMGRIARCPLAFQPGTEWRYSLGMDVEGAIIERLTGRSLADFMAERIFTPLGMRDTRFFTPSDETGRLATLYAQIGDAPLQPIGNPMFPDYQSEPAVALGGAGLISTASDYARFAQFLLDRGAPTGTPLLSAAAMHQMRSNHLADHLIARGFMAGQQIIRPGAGFGVNGIVFTDPELAGMPVGRGTYQWDGAANTWFWIDPEHDLLFIGMTQFMSYNAPPLQATTQRLLAKAIRV